METKIRSLFVSIPSAPLAAAERHQSRDAQETKGHRLNKKTPLRKVPLGLLTKATPSTQHWGQPINGIKQSPLHNWPN
jgi:hypothetical protein